MELSVGLVPTSARGLRVLLVDNDTTTLMYMASLLEEHSYKVTTTELASVALSMIRNRKGQYDVVIAEVNMPEMNGFVFVDKIIPQVDIPIILMSVDPKGDLARKALEKGACFFFEKPIPTKHIINVWQHIFRNKRCMSMSTTQTEKSKENSVCDLKTSHSPASIQHLIIDNIKGKTKILIDNNHVTEPQGVLDVINNSSKKSIRVEEDNEKKSTEKTSRTRVKWTPELHHKFIQALIKLGEKRPNPKAVLKLMDVPYLTHRHVASHLQKYRDRIKQISSDCEKNPPMHAQSTFNFYGENKSKFGRIPVTMASQSIGSSVHFTLETIKRQLESFNSNINNTPQNGLEGNGMGKQLSEAVGQCGNFCSNAAPANVNQEVNGATPDMDPTWINGDHNDGVCNKLDINEVMRMLEEDDDEFDEDLMGEDCEILWDQLLKDSSPSGFDDDFSGGAVA